MQANWNPWHGCTKTSPGCLHCYMYRTDIKHGNDPTLVRQTKDFSLPIKMNRNGSYKIPSGSLVWTCFTSDFFHKEADSWREEVWNMILERQDLYFFLITKRIDRFSSCVPSNWGRGWDNVEIGCTCENQEMANYRMPIFINAPIQKKVIICEPLLESINFSDWLKLDKLTHESNKENNGKAIYKIVAGGESGTDARICKFEWMLSLRSQCVQNQIAFHFKQTGAHFEKDGKVYNIPRAIQHKQAHKANINYNSDSLLRISNWKDPKVNNSSFQPELF